MSDTHAAENVGANLTEKSERIKNDYLDFICGDTPEVKELLMKSVESYCAAVVYSICSPAHCDDKECDIWDKDFEKYTSEIKAIQIAPESVKPLIPFIAVELSDLPADKLEVYLTIIASHYTQGGQLKDKDGVIPPEIRERIKKARRKYNRFLNSITNSAENQNDKARSRNTMKDVASVILKASYIKQGLATNELSRTIPTKHNTETNPISHVTTITRGDFSIAIPNYDQLPNISTSTFKQLDAFLMCVAQGDVRDKTVYLELDDYIERRGLKNRQEARNRMTADAEILLSIAITGREKVGGKWRDFRGVAIGDSWGWLDGNRTRMYFKFGDTFYNEHLKNYRTMYYPPELADTDDKINKNSYHLGRKIAELKSMNRGKDNEDLISVKTLLSVAPFIPSYENVMSGNRNVTGRIIEPFERDMDALKDIFTWEYCHSKGTPLTDDEISHMDYSTFIKLLVHIIWKNYPKAENASNNV